jgi:hypothetical protein
MKADIVHKAFAHISGTTLYNRTKKGLYPYESGGGGKPFEYSESGTVHIGVVDEWMALGAWGPAAPGTIIEIDFFPGPKQKNYFEEYQRQYAQTHKEQEPSDHEKAVKFYELHNYHCFVGISIKHVKIRGSLEKRRKRATRTLYIWFYADPDLWVGAENPGPLTGGVDLVGEFSVYTTAVVDVEAIHIAVLDALRRP